MADLVIMPKLGFNMSEGRLVKWYKNEGDPIKKGEALFSVETDKTSIDIEATNDGYVRKLLINEGDTLKVTLPIAIIGEKEENIDDTIKDAYAQLGKEADQDIEQKPTQASQSPVIEKTLPATVRSGGRLMASPRAKRVAAELEIDLSTADINGTGFEGGICEADVLNYAKSAPKVRATPLAKAIAADKGVDLSTLQGSGVGGKILKEDVRTVLDKKDAKVSSEAEVTVDGKIIRNIVPYEGVRQIIGERLSESKIAAPHVYFTQKVDMENLLILRKQVNESIEVKTSVTDFIARAVVLAVAKHPQINSSLVSNRIEEYKSVNVGIAVASPSGLIVPVVKGAEGMRIVEIAETSKALIEKARQGKLTPDEYSGGTFTISNLGMFGIENFTAIINPPEAAILAVSATKDEAFVITNASGDKEVAIKPVMNITLSVDHRIIDGLLAAQFVTEIKTLLENPVCLLV